MSAASSEHAEPPQTNGVSSPFPRYERALALSTSGEGTVSVPRSDAAPFHELAELRRELTAAGGDYKVYKNTLVRLAVVDTPREGMSDLLTGPTAIVFAGEDPVAPAKALKTFGDANKPVEIKAAYIDGQIVDAKGVAQLAALPPKIELLSRLVGSLKSPLSGLVYVLSGNQSGLVRVLNQVREQKEAAGSAA